MNVDKKTSLEDQTTTPLQDNSGTTAEPLPNASNTTICRWCKKPFPALDGHSICSKECIKAESEDYEKRKGRAEKNNIPEDAELHFSVLQDKSIYLLYFPMRSWIMNECRKSNYTIALLLMQARAQGLWKSIPDKKLIERLRFHVKLLYKTHFLHKITKQTDDGKLGKYRIYYANKKR